MSAQPEPQVHVAGFGADRMDVAALAAAIADQHSVDIIRACCRVVVSGQHDWYDVGTCELADWSNVDRSVEYLQRRGADASSPMVRSRSFPMLVRFEPRA